jgi:hypothetical protein
MANVKITDLSAASTPLVGDELFEVVQSGTSLKVAASDIAASFSTDAANILPVANGGTGAATLTGYVKGAGTDVMTAAATVPFGDISSRAYGQFCSVADQTGDVADPKAVKLATNVITGAGISVANNGSGDPTRVTFTAAGTYMVAPNIQFVNSDTNDHDATVWLRKNGTDVANSATRIVVPKTADGGAAFFQLVFYETVTANQYIEVMWLPENAAVTIDHTAAAAGPPAVPAIPSAIVAAERIA